MAYYRAVRTAEGKVVKQYLGCGERAAAAAAAVARARALRAAERQAVLDEQARLAGPEGLTSALIQVAQVALEATLLVCGFHRQNYGKWRRKREQEEGSRATTSI
jgi:hypothetical protein